MKRLPWFLSQASDTSIGYSVLRIYLGIALFVRGVMFVTRPDVINEFLKGRASSAWFMPMVTMAVSHYVAVAHLCGGILLALGLATRVAAALRVPVLVGALLFVHYGDRLLRVGQSLELAALVLCMLLVYSVFGAGKLSLDALLQKRLKEHDAASPRAATTRPLPLSVSQGTHGK